MVYRRDLVLSQVKLDPYIEMHYTWQMKGVSMHHLWHIDSNRSKKVDQASKREETQLTPTTHTYSLCAIH